MTPAQTIHDAILASQATGGDARADNPPADAAFELGKSAVLATLAAEVPEWVKPPFDGDVYREAREYEAGYAIQIVENQYHGNWLAYIQSVIWTSALNAPPQGSYHHALTAITAALGALAAAPQPPADAADIASASREGWTAEDAWQSLLDKDDRTSPEGYPEMCLITSEELRGYMLAAAPPAPTDEAGGMSARPYCSACDGTGLQWYVPAGVNPFEMRLPQLTRAMRKVACFHCRPILPTPTPRRSVVTGSAEELSALLGKVTPGEWRLSRLSFSPIISVEGGVAKNEDVASVFRERSEVEDGRRGETIHRTIPQPRAEANAAFIVAAKNLLPEVLAENERMRKALIRLRDCDWTIGRGDRMDPVRDIARAALTQGPKP